MNTFKHILLASHNTDGAKAAESLAIQLAGLTQAKIKHLIIVPEFWQWMTGDDWLNNAHTQQEYGDYIESELQREIIEHIDRLKSLMLAEAIDYSYKLTKGAPDKVLIDEINNVNYDLVVIGSSRPKGVDGLNSKLLTKSLPAQMRSPLLIAPYPNHEQ